MWQRTSNKEQMIKWKLNMALHLPGWATLFHCSINWVWNLCITDINCSSFPLLTDPVAWWILFPRVGEFFPRKYHQTNFHKFALSPTTFLMWQVALADWGWSWGPGAYHEKASCRCSARATVRTHQSSLESQSSTLIVRRHEGTTFINQHKGRVEKYLHQPISLFWSSI